jgi:eukaryotic-like serine/threonine-protein kinase
VDQQAEAESLLEQALRLTPEEREAFLVKACKSEELRQEIADLVLHANGDSDFLDSPVRRPATPDWAELLASGAGEQAARQACGLPEVIGGYRIVRLLGHGGMGLIYEARRAGGEDAVALKIPYPGLVTPEVLRRFAAETRVLSRLRSPGIARVLEAGVERIRDPGGTACLLPFLIMELIRGERLDHYVRRVDPSLGERLRVFAEICDAVHHAHQQGVLHRDLKPANILVEESGRPKVVDFGIALMLERTGESGRLTTTGNVIGSLAYLSPEQLGSGRRRADASGDIYALGVILYEMLAGLPPFDLRGLSVAEAAVLISRSDAPPLGAHDRALAGDLERIAARAIAKDPAKRYRSAAELAGDVRRGLGSAPIPGPRRGRDSWRAALARLERRIDRAFGWLLPPSLRGCEDLSQLNVLEPEMRQVGRPEMGGLGMAQAADSTGDVPPIIIDVGKVKRRDLRDFREGHGTLAQEVTTALEETRKSLSPEAAKKELVPVVLVYRKRQRRRKKGSFPFF